MERRHLDKATTGLNYRNKTYMVAGYLSDYALTYDEDILGKMDASDQSHTINDFEENRGYVDDAGFVYIFRQHPDPKELIPWFTVEMDGNGSPRLVFNQRRSKETRCCFRVERVGDLSVKRIINETGEGEELYNQEIKKDLLSSSSNFVPVIRDKDDYLKKLVKMSILEKGCDVHRYKAKLPQAYSLSNLIQGINGSTKIGPFVFLTWMELLGLDFELTVYDNGTDTQDPLPRPLQYDSMKNEIRVLKKEEEPEDAVEKTKVARSARQFH